jgi:hypothetical protein
MQISGRIRLYYVIAFTALCSLAALRPVMPCLEYLIHFDHIIQELCLNRQEPTLDCSGKCYLGEQLARATDDGPADEKTPISQNFDKGLILFIEPDISFSLALIHKKDAGIMAYDFSLSENATQPSVPPPRV